MAIRFFFFLLSLLVLTSKPLWAQFAQIEGSVKSEGDPVSYASIALEGTSVGTISDENGHFRLENLQEGIHTLLITSVGYSDFSQEIELSNGKTVNIAVELQAEVTQMDEFVVSGTMRPMRLSDSPIKIEVISQKQMDLFLPGPSSSVTDNLQLINGVQEVVACGVCYTNSISINGLPGAYTAVLLDGTPMYGNLASVYGLNGLPNMIIERMEVIKGPSSTLYGSEAVAGVINIITKNPENQPLVDIDIMTTTQQEIFGNLSIAPKIGNTSGYIGLNWANSFGFFDANNDFMGDIVNQDQYSLFTKWNISRKSELPLTVSAKYFYEDRRNGVEEFMEGRNYRTLRGNDSIYGESIYTHRFEMLGTYAFSAVLKLDASVSWHDQNSLYGSDSYLANQQVAFGNLIYRPILDRHDLILGLTARWNGYDDNTVATEIESEGETINQPDNQFIPGVFIQDEFTVNDGLSILGGLRFDHYEHHGPILSPRFNLKWKPGEWSTLRFNFGTGFRVVNLFTEDHAFVTGRRQVEIEDPLEPEQSYNASLSFNQVYTLGNGSGTLDIEAFYTHFENKIVVDYSTPGMIIYRNVPEYAQTMGIGLSVNHRFSFPLSFNLGINVQEVTQSITEEEEVISIPIEFAPKWTGLLSMNYEFKKLRMTVGYNVSVTGPMQLPKVYDLDSNGEPLSNPRPTTSPTFAIHSLKVSKNFNKGWAIYAGMENIFDYRQPVSPLSGYDDPNHSTGFSPHFDSAYSYAPMHGREFYVGAKWLFGGRK